MKKVTAGILVCLMILPLLAGCTAPKAEQEPASQMVAIGNPWTDWASIAEAEAAVGFVFGLPEDIGGFAVAEIRTMNNELLEIVYRRDDFEVCVRKQAGEGQDISGDYNLYETSGETDRGGATVTFCRNSGNGAIKQLLSYRGYSWSLVALKGFGESSEWDFVDLILAG